MLYSSTTESAGLTGRPETGTEGPWRQDISLPISYYSSITASQSLPSTNILVGDYLTLSENPEGQYSALILNTTIVIESHSDPGLPPSYHQLNPYTGCSILKATKFFTLTSNFPANTFYAYFNIEGIFLY